MFAEFAESFRVIGARINNSHSQVISGKKFADLKDYNFMSEWLIQIGSFSMKCLH